MVTLVCIVAFFLATTQALQNLDRLTGDDLARFELYHSGEKLAGELSLAQCGVSTGCWCVLCAEWLWFTCVFDWLSYVVLSNRSPHGPSCPFVAVRARLLMTATTTATSMVWQQPCVPPLTLRPVRRRRASPARC